MGNGVLVLIDLNMTIQEQIIETARSIHIPGMKPISNPFVEVLHIETFNDFLIANLYIGGFYYALYLVGGGMMTLIQQYLNGRTPPPRRTTGLSQRKSRSRWGLSHCSR
jgi:hypothetical protein